MAQQGVFFNGRWIIHPGAYSVIDADNMTSMNDSGSKIIALIGSSKGGVPGEIMWFNNPTDAKATLKGGYLLKAAQKAWSPTPKGEGAYLIACIRANKATQSTLDMGDGIPVTSKIGDVIKTATNASTGSVTVSGTYTGTSDNVIEVIIDSDGTKDLSTMTFGWRYKGQDWVASKLTTGQAGTEIALVDGIKIKFGTGDYALNSVWQIPVFSKKDFTIGGTLLSKDYGAWTKKIQCKLENGTVEGTKKLTTYYWEDDKYEILDNLGASMYLRYTGAQAYSELNITHDDTGKAVRLTTKIGADATSAIVDLDIDLTESRFKRIRDLADFISGYQNYACRYYPVVNPNVAATDLDIVTAKSLKVEVLLTATWRDLEVTIANSSEYIAFNRGSRTCGLPENFPYTPLTGGSDGEIPSSWAEFYDKLSAYDITSIVPLSGDPVIHAEAKASVEYLSNNMGKERVLKLGGYASESLVETKQRALTNNSDRVQLVYPGFYDTNEYGETELYPPFVAAAMLAGRQVYLGTGDSATFNYFNVVGLEKTLEPKEVDELLQAGVATMEYVINKGYRLVQDITTYTSDTKSLYTERSVRDLADVLNKELRVKIEEQVIGKKGIYNNVSGVKNMVISYLQQKIRDEVIVAYKNVRVTYLNRVITIEYEAAPVEPTNYALIKGHFYTADEIVG
jgi:hypothetical protein